MSNHIECPRCGDRWYEDIEPDTGNPYGCYFCCNGSVNITQEMIDEDRGPAAPKSIHPRWKIIR